MSNSVLPRGLFVIWLFQLWHVPAMSHILCPEGLLLICTPIRMYTSSMGTLMLVLCTSTDLLYLNIT